MTDVKSSDPLALKGIGSSFTFTVKELPGTPTLESDLQELEAETEYSKSCSLKVLYPDNTKGFEEGRVDVDPPEVEWVVMLI